MKFSKAFFIILLVITISSCSSDDSPTVNNSNIVGTWSLVDYDYVGTSESTIFGETYTTSFVGEGKNLDATITFQENPNVIVSEGSFDIVLTYELLGETYVEEVNDINFIEDGEWSISGNILQLNANGEDSEMLIEELTDTRMVLSIEDVEETNQDGVITVSNVEARVTYTRN